MKKKRRENKSQVGLNLDMYYEFRVTKEKHFQNLCISKIHVSKVKNIKKRASQVFFDPIQNCALSRSV